ncbi:MAG TPA: glycosyl hydrolase family 18 protein [Dehalococcoidia bacterium]
MNRTPQTPFSSARGGPFDRLLDGGRPPRRRRARPPVSFNLGRPPRIPDRRPLLIGGAVVLAALLLFLLFLPPFSLLLGGGGDRPVELEALGQPQDLPAGLTAASPLLRLEAPGDVQGQVRLTVRLDVRAEPGAAYGFYTYAGGEWRLLGPATPTEDGLAVSAAFEGLPENVAVLLQGDAGVKVIGEVPSGASLHPDAVGLLSFYSPRDFTPRADGAVPGGYTAPEDATGLRVVPSVNGGTEEAAAAVDRILSDEALWTQHAQRLAALARDAGFDGIDIRYTRVRPELREPFTGFITTLSRELHREGRMLSVTLPAPVRRPDGTWDTSAYDWEAIGRAAEVVKVLPVEDPAVYREQMPAALAYASALVGAKKLYLVVSPWSVDRTASGAERVSRLEALSRVVHLELKTPEPVRPGTEVQIEAPYLRRPNNVPPLWDAVAASVRYWYQAQDGRHDVWIENEFSTGFKLELVQRLGLGGVAVDDASTGPEGYNIWPVIQTFLEDGQAPLVQPDLAMIGTDCEASTGPEPQCGEGSTITWRAPDQGGQAQISLYVSDGSLRVRGSLTVNVQASAPTPTPSPTPTPRPGQ